MHSPFVFDFIVNVLNNKRHYIPDKAVERRRKELLHNKTFIELQDFGAGSRTAATKVRRVDRVARSVLKPKKYAQLLYRVVKHYQPSRILELGTSFGVTTSYLASGAPSAEIVSIEGSRSVAALATETITKLGANNVKLVIGNFDEVLPAVLQELPQIDFAFVDGNHRFEPTVRYFHQIIEKAHGGSIMIFDDIHWSSEMEAAWTHIKEDSRVRCTVDLFFVGLVFFNSSFKEKQHFTIRF